MFRGVPYAAAPTGSQRLAAPRPHPPWTEIRDATADGPTAPQPARDAFGSLDMSPFFGPGWRRGADYLTVNIWVPDRRHQPAPVMVFVPGGGFVAGSTSAPVYDGSTFARDGVVLVTVNYRLGIPGFLHLRDAPDNRGLLDVLAALRWVRDNAAGFGGDPGRITLFGQSAGATIVGGVLADPASAGIVRQAIIQSATATGAFSVEQAGIVTAAVGRELGVTPTARALAEMSDEQLVAVPGRLPRLDLRTATHHDPLGGLTPFSLVLDVQPAAAAARDVALLIGSNLEEGSLYRAPLGDAVDTVDVVAARFHRRPDDLIAAYRRSRPAATAAELGTAILGDGLFGAGTRQMAAAHVSAGAPTWGYEFTWRSNALDGRLGASHAMELPFVFDVTDLPALHGPNALLGTAGPPADLALRMHAAWVRFATTGDPGWAPQRPGRASVQSIGSDWDLIDDPRPLETAAWT